MTRPNRDDRLILGVDPGGRSTGLVVRRGDRLCHAELLVRKDEPVEWFAERCAATVQRILARHEVACTKIEMVTPPRGFKAGKRQPINPAGLIGPALVAGAVATASWIARVPVLWVPPAGHGATPSGLPRGHLLDAWMSQRYPTQVLPRRCGGAYVDNKRHLRSAWDVAGSPASPVMVMAEAQGKLDHVVPC